VVLAAGLLKRSRVEPGFAGAQDLPAVVEAQEISDWVAACTAPETADNSGNTVVLPNALTRSDLVLLSSHGHGRTLQIRLKYDTGISAPTSPVIQAFGFDGTGTPSQPIGSPMRLLDGNGDHELTLTIDTTNDVRDGSFKYTKPVEVDMAACSNFLIAVKTAFAATGTVNNSVIQVRSCSRPVTPPIEAVLGSSLTAGEEHIGEVGGRSALPSGNFTRPNDTTAYASGDLVANSTTAGSVTPIALAVGRGTTGAAITGMIRRLKLRKSGTSVTNASFRVHLYNATSITFANGDNGAWSTNKVANHIGSFDITMDLAFTDGASGIGTPRSGSEVNFTTQNVYAVIEARGAYTPTAQEVFTLEAEVLQN
jgi:hypothetical protein